MKYLKYSLLAPLIVIALAVNLSAAELSAEQLQKKEKYLMKFDVNNDKALSEAEFIAMTKAQFQKKKKAGWEVEGKKRFARNDANGDGKVTFAEWLKQQKKN